MAASPAAAQAPATLAAAGCVVPANSLSCSTAAVPAGSDGAVYFNVNTGIAWCNFYVRDIFTNRVVREGAFAGSVGGRVTGLTNWYRVELRRCLPGSSAAIW